MKKIIALIPLFALIILGNSCEKSDLTLRKKTTIAGEQLTFYGPQVHVGSGKARSWIVMGHDNKPIELGIELTAGALQNLPHPGDGEMHPSWDIPFHPKVKNVTPFYHLVLNWNPEGHPPVFFADPHFDIHFYMITEAERMAIPAWSPATDVYFNTYPPPAYLPPSYSTLPGPVGSEPAMGKHWLPPPPTFLPFHDVMILGTYNGHFTFIEPMVTLDLLQSGQSVSKDYPQPQKFEKAGNYPTKYNIWVDGATGHIFISLSHFVWRNAE